MADPFSIASGVAGLLSLGIQVTQSLVDFYSAYKDQANDLAKITQNLESLLNLFKSLDHALLKRQHTDTLVQEINTVTKRCSEIIEELQTECQRFQKEAATGIKGRIQVAGRRVIYPFRKSTLQKLEEDIGEMRENLYLALEILQVEQHNELGNEVLGIKSLFESLHANQAFSAIRVWLTAPDATINHNVACEKRHPNTGLWFVKGFHFQNWLIERNSFLWINGFAGSGKSVLFSTAVQQTCYQRQHIPGVGIGFFYFSFADESKRRASSMICALLVQLSAQLKDGQEQLKPLYNQHQPGTPPVEALLECLRDIVCQFSDAYILLDALDESNRNTERDEVLKAIQVMRQWDLPGLHLMTTSRDELAIREGLEVTENEEIRMRNSDIDDDITEFITHQLRTDSKLQRWELRHAEIQGVLKQKAQGLFRYVECQLMELKKARNRIQLDKCLLSLPQGLNETYERILCNIDPMYIEDVKRFLMLLCVSTEALTVDQLLEAHAVDISDSPHFDPGRLYSQDGLLEVCSGLVVFETPTEQSGRGPTVARIAHFSVQEYLESQCILQQGAAGFAVREKHASSEIAQICLVYLMEPKLSDGEFNEERLADFPLTRFAAKNWFHFFENSSKDSKAEGFVMRFFRDEPKSFLAWTQLYDVDMVFENHWILSPSDADKPSSLYYAAFLGLDHVANSLMESSLYRSHAGADPNTKGGLFGNALSAASHNGHSKIVQKLLAEGADVNNQGGLYGSALQAASRSGHEQTVNILLDKGANFNACGGLFGTALEAASYGGHENIVRILLRRGADINVDQGLFGTALDAASESGHENIVRMLLSQGAIINAQKALGGNVLDVTSFRLHDAGVQIGYEDGMLAISTTFYGSCLQAASFKGHERIVQILLEKGADVNARGGFCSNPLQVASLQGYQTMTKLLLDQGGDLEEKSAQLISVHRASVDAFRARCTQSNGSKIPTRHVYIDPEDHLSDNPNMIHVLFEGDYSYCIDVNHGSIYWSSIWSNEKLQWALDRGITSGLLQIGHNCGTLTLEDAFYGDALQAASWGENENIVQMLLDRGADVNAEGGLFGSALEAASLRGNKKIVQMLLDRGAKANVEDERFSPGSDAWRRLTAPGRQRHMVELRRIRGPDARW